MPSTRPSMVLVDSRERALGTSMLCVSRCGVASKGATAKSENGAPSCDV